MEEECIRKCFLFHLWIKLFPQNRLVIHTLKIRRALVVTPTTVR